MAVRLLPRLRDAEEQSSQRQEKLLGKRRLKRRQARGQDTVAGQVKERGVQPEETLVA